MGFVRILKKKNHGLILINHRHRSQNPNSR